MKAKVDICQFIDAPECYYLNTRLKEKKNEKE
jgi:hypothetical protein